MEFCNLNAQYQKYKEEIDSRVSQVINSSMFIGGPEVRELESSLTDYVGANSLTCANGTDAIELALLALGIGAGDEVITTPFTFFATVEMIVKVGAKPVFVDIGEKDFNIDFSKIERVITQKTKAILVVSLYGLPCDMEPINLLAKSHGLFVIEDAAQSFGSTYKGVRSCNLSDFATTSFFPAKPLGCFGDGGAVFSKDKVFLGEVSKIKNHGQSERYRHQKIGVNSRLDAIQAAVLNVKLKYYDEELLQRSHIASRYSELLSACDVVTPGTFNDRESAWAQYTLRVSDRAKLMKKFEEKGLPYAVHYPVPVHLQEAMAWLGLKEGAFPVAEKISKEVFSLPMSAFLTENEQIQIVKAILD